MNDKKNCYYKQQQQKNLPSIIIELKKCDSYSRPSKFYDKTIKSKKIREMMKTMGLIKIKGFSELKMFHKSIKRKEEIPFDINKVKEYLLKEEQEKIQKEIDKQEKLNNTVAKKLHKMTELNIEQLKNKHQYLSPSIGTYNPNYDAIYKKPKATIFFEKRKDNSNNLNNLVRNKSGFNMMKNLSLTNINNSKQFSTISSRNIDHPILTERKTNIKNYSIFSYNIKEKNENPLSKDQNKNYNTISNIPFSFKKYKVKKNIFIKEFENKNNNSTNSIKNNSDSSYSFVKQNSNNNLDIFSKTRPKNIDSYLGHKNAQRNNLASRNNEKLNKDKNLTLKTLYIKPELPCIGYYNPKYDIIKANIPKISFLYHNIKKDDKNYKKYLLRKIMTNYNVEPDYQIIKSLNNK